MLLHLEHPVADVLHLVRGPGLLDMQQLGVLVVLLHVVCPERRLSLFEELELLEELHGVFFDDLQDPAVHVSFEVNHLGLQVAEPGQRSVPEVEVEAGVVEVAVAELGFADGEVLRAASGDDFLASGDRVFGVVGRSNQVVLFGQQRQVRAGNSSACAGDAWPEDLVGSADDGRLDRPREEVVSADCLVVGHDARALGERGLRGCFLWGSRFRCSQQLRPGRKRGCCAWLP